MDFTDQLIHVAHRLPARFRPTAENIRCRNCGSLLQTYYAENRLYAVMCYGCDYVAIVRASSPSGAAAFFGDKIDKEDNHDD